MASSTTDSGTETLFSDESARESSCELISPTSVCSAEDACQLSKNDSYASCDRLAGHQQLAPPNIQPYSGVLEKGKVVIKPIAFKPQNSNNMSPSSKFSERYGSTPILARPGSRLTLYGSSTDLSTTPRPLNQINNYSLDRKLRTSSHHVSQHSTVASSPLAMSSLPSLPNSHKLSNYNSIDSLNSVAKSPQNCQAVIDSLMKNQPYRLSSSNLGSLGDLTPSPSDSGMSELEAALRDRDSELAYLRQTMEHNEQVIFRVYKEKEKVWERELQRIKTLHESRLRASAQKSLKLEHMLMMQSYQFNQDKKRLLGEVQRANFQTEKLKSEVTALRSRLEETEWALCQKTGEISLLKTQLKDYQNDQASKCQELLQLRNDFREVHNRLQNCEEALQEERNQNFDRENQILALKSEVDHLRNEANVFRDNNFDLKNVIEEKHSEIQALQQEIDNCNKKYLSTDSLNKNIDDISENERLRAEIKELREELSDISLNDYNNIKPGRLLRAEKIIIDDSNEDLTSEDLEIQKLNGEYIKENNIYGDISNNELKKLKKELDLKSQEFEQEKLNWSQEKEKVLRYQRQLQTNYIQIFRKCKNLETEVQNLSIQLAIDQQKNKEKSVDNKNITQNP